VIFNPGAVSILNVFIYFLIMIIRISFILFLILNSFSSAQTVTQSAMASVNLVVPLSMTAVEGSLDFGEIILTGSSFTQNINPTNGQRFLISGQPNRGITILYTSIELTNAGNPPAMIERIGNLTFTPNVENDSGVSILNGETVTLEDKGNVGEYELWVGGSIFIGSNQPHGDYTGTFTITVNY
jgi:spore coat protein U-like protein